MKKSLVIGVLLYALLCLFIGQSFRPVTQKGKQESSQPMVKADSAQVTETIKLENYVVRKGDCLWKLSRKTFKESGTEVKDWLEANPIIKNKDLIKIGWSLIVPAKKETAAKETQKKKADKQQLKDRKEKREGFAWENPNREPFGNRNMFKMIDKFNVPEEIKKQWKEKIADNEYELFTIYNGLYLAEMAFGEYKIKEETTVLWLESYSKVTRQAKVYIAATEDKAYYLLVPEICNNLGWWSEEIETKQISAAKTAEKEEKKKEEIPLLPPAVIEKKAEVKSEIKPEEKLVIKQEEPRVEVIEKSESRGQCSLTFDFESSLFGGIYEFPEGWGGDYGFWGNDTSIFVATCAMPKSRFRIGPSFQYLRWNGEIGENRTGFQGQRQLYGLEGQYLTANTKTSLKVRRGVKHGHSETPKDLYKADEEAEILSFDFYHLKWYQRKWLPLLEVGARADIAFLNSKRSTVDGEVLTYSQDHPADQSEYFIRVRADIYKGKIATPFIEVPVGYRSFDRNYLVDPTLGLKFFKEVLEIKGSYQLVEGRDNNGLGILGVINLHNMPKFFKTKNNKK